MKPKQNTTYINVNNMGSYIAFLQKIKKQIQQAQIKSSLSINRELTKLYWNIGKEIAVRQEKDGWGKSIVEKLSKDLHREFSEMKGFSPRNLWNMRQFYTAYKDYKNLQQLVAEIPWGHNLVLLSSINDITERTWYIQQVIEYGWSRNVLIHQTESKQFERTGKAVTNFKRTLPPPQSDLAQQILKDPYYFDFLAIDQKVREKELEDNLIMHQDDNPTIGLMLCKRKNKIIVEYALKDIKKPIGVSEYHLTKKLPRQLKGSLPTIQEIEAEVSMISRKRGTE